MTRATKVTLKNERAELDTVEREATFGDRGDRGGATIELEGVSKSFGAVRALDGIDLVVPPGTVEGLLGPNGAGKTTLRLLATLLAPDAGRARIAGVDVARDPHTVRTGMRRRLDLGASLVGRPRVLLVDEPTTGLDPRARVDVWNFIRDLVVAGTTVLLTTQYLDEADQLADHIVVIDRGRLIAGGRPEDLKHRVGSDLLELEMAAADLEPVTRLLAGIGRENAQRGGEGTRICIPVAHPVADLMAAIRLLDRAGVTPLDIRLRRPSLDDVFLALTGRSTEEPETSSPVRRSA